MSVSLTVVALVGSASVFNAPTETNFANSIAALALEEVTTVVFVNSSSTSSASILTP